MKIREIPPDILKTLLDYDPQTGKLFWRNRPRKYFKSNRSMNSWNARFAGKPAFTSRLSTGYFTGSIFSEDYYAHRVIWALANNEWPPDQTDHIDGNKGNNKFNNLRAASRIENGKNQKLPCDNLSGVMGVDWDTRRKKWRAQIRSNGKGIHIGRFNSKEEAITARKAAELKHGFHPNHGRAS